MLRTLSVVRRQITILNRGHSTHEPEVPKKTKEQIMMEKTPKGSLDHGQDEHSGKDEPYVDPYLPKHPGGVNPVTGEYGGPAGPEPTRYGDWERKGRVTDF